MSNILTEQDTFFGSIAFRNKLITREQLSEAVVKVQSTEGLRLGQALVDMGYATRDQVDAILRMQKEQREILESQKPPEAPSAPPLPAEKPAEPSKMSVEPPPPLVIEPTSMSAEPPPTPEALSTPEPPPAEEPPRVVKPFAPSRSSGVDFSVPEAAVAPPAPPSPPAAPPSPGPTIASAPAEKKAAEAAPKIQPKPAAVEPPRKDAGPPMEVDAPPLAGAADVPTKLRNLYDYLAYARAANASDLHISAEVRPFLRLSGRLHQLEVPELPAHETERLLFEVLSVSQKSLLLEKRGLEFCLDVPEQGRYRASVIKQRCGWDGIFHVIRGAVPSFEELGLPDCLKRLTEYNQGLALVTGPGNSGKTTTMASLLDAINQSRPDHIITVEEPVEYIHTSNLCQITQREVGNHTKSFSVALRAALREDPDVIMVGELRDLETLSMAISASETGHLVFGSLHTISAATTVGRIVDAFPVGQQSQIRMMISESLRGIISQQLVPRKDGAGVVLALEILFITSAVSALIRDNKPFQIPSIMQTSRKIGMCRMDDSLLDLVSSDTIEGAEAYRRADNKTMFELYNPANAV